MSIRNPESYRRRFNSGGEGRESCFAIEYPFSSLEWVHPFFEHQESSSLTWRRGWDDERTLSFAGTAIFIRIEVRLGNDFWGYQRRTRNRSLFGRKEKWKAETVKTGIERVRKATLSWCLHLIRPIRLWDSERRKDVDREAVLWSSCLKWRIRAIKSRQYTSRIVIWRYLRKFLLVQYGIKRRSIKGRSNLSSPNGRRTWWEHHLLAKLYKLEYISAFKDQGQVPRTDWTSSHSSNLKDRIRNEEGGPSN